MAIPISAIILNLIQSAMEGVTVANGYQVTVAEVYRVTTLGGYSRTPPGSYIVQMVVGDDQRAEELDIQGADPVIAWRMPIELGLIYRPSDTNTTPIDQILRQFLADVTRAVMEDPQWEQYAMDTTLGPPQAWANQEAGEVGYTANMSVAYRVKESDPYQLPSNPPAWTMILDGGHADTEEYDLIIEANGI